MILGSAAFSSVYGYHPWEVIGAKWELFVDASEVNQLTTNLHRAEAMANEKTMRNYHDIAVDGPCAIQRVTMQSREGRKLPTLLVAIAAELEGISSGSPSMHIVVLLFTLPSSRPLLMQKQVQFFKSTIFGDRSYDIAVADHLTSSVRPDIRRLPLDNHFLSCAIENLAARTLQDTTFTIQELSVKVVSLGGSQCFVNRFLYERACELSAALVKALEKVETESSEDEAKSATDVESIPSLASLRELVEEPVRLPSKEAEDATPKEEKKLDVDQPAKDLMPSFETPRTREQAQQISAKISRRTALGTPAETTQVRKHPQQTKAKLWEELGFGWNDKKKKTPGKKKAKAHQPKADPDDEFKRTEMDRKVARHASARPQ